MSSVSCACGSTGAGEDTAAAGLLSRASQLQQLPLTTCAALWRADAQNLESAKLQGPGTHFACAPAESLPFSLLRSELCVHISTYIHVTDRAGQPPRVHASCDGGEQQALQHRQASRSSRVFLLAAEPAAQRPDGRQAQAQQHRHPVLPGRARSHHPRGHRSEACDVPLTSVSFQSHKRSAA